MLKHKNIRHFILAMIILAMIASIAGCKKFLDAPSPYQVQADELFNSQTGFQDALNGVYLQMGSSALYGKELQFGLLSVLARSYDTVFVPQLNALYYEGARLNYAHPAVKSTIRNYWDSSYLCILNINVILSHIDQKQDLFSADNYASTKSELLALRAFLHFDLLRMFGPDNPSANLNTVVLPYMDTVSNMPKDYSTGAEIINHCISDLEAARALLNNKTVNATRLGYWGITGLLARIYLYKGDYSNASIYANEAMNSNSFPLSTTNADIQFRQEIMFSIIVPATQLGRYQKAFFGATPGLGLSPAGQTIVFVINGGSTNDWRRLNQFINPANGSTIPAAALVQPRKLNYSSSIANIAPLIRCTEMYYIAAECANANKDTITATNLINRVRQARNFPANSLPLLTQSNILAELQREYMKEYLGEAQAFFFFKRRNLSIPSLPLQKVTPIANALYAFPVPE